MPSIRCSYASHAQLPAANSATAERWLSPHERQAWDAMSAPERRATWLAGRIVAKRLLLACLREANDPRGALEPSEFHIETRSANPGHGQRPTILAAGQLLGWALSIAHTERGVLAAVATEPGVTPGVDLVCGRQQASERLAWCFTEAERHWLAAGPAHQRPAEQLWAMKEALYKACHQGEGFVPGRIEVAPQADPHYPGLAQPRAVRSLQSWRVDGQFAALAIADAGVSHTCNGAENAYSTASV